MPTNAELAKTVASLTESVAAIANAVGASSDDTPEPKAKASKAKASKASKAKASKAKATEAKAKTIARDLDTETVELLTPDGDTVTFEVRATVPIKRSDGEWGEGVSHKGARTLLLKPNGMAAKALTPDAITALAATQDDDGEVTGADMLAFTVGHVEKRAKIGAYSER